MSADVRRGVPSASKMHRVAACPASFHMEAVAPHEEASDDAASGTRIHAVLASEAPESTLNADEAQTVEMCSRQAQELLEEWHSGAPFTAHIEQRLGMTKIGNVIPVTDDSKAVFVMTGQGDLVHVERDNDRAIVIDYKTGRMATADAVDNAQLASLALLVSRRHNVQNVRCAIVAPWVGKPTVTDYNEEALEMAGDWLARTLEAADKATPEDARAGEHCRYCRAKPGCPAFKRAALEETQYLRTAEVVSMQDPKAALFARAMELSAKQLAAAMRGLELVTWYRDAIKGAARVRAESDPEFQQFYTLKSKAGRRSIEDVGAVFARASAQGVTAEAFTAECSIALGSVKDLLKTATKKKGKELEALNDEVLGDAVSMGNPTKELVAVDMIDNGSDSEQE